MGLLALALVASGCGGGDDADQDPGFEVSRIGEETDEDPVGDVEPEPEPEPEPDPEPEPEPEPEPDPEPATEDDPDEFAVPDEIDAEYVDRVVNSLYAISSDLLRQIVSRDNYDSLTDDDLAILGSVYSGNRLATETDDFVRFATDSKHRAGLLPPEELGRVWWSTDRFVVADHSCVVAIGIYDVSETAADPVDDGAFTAISLVPAEPDAINPAPWTIIDQRPLISPEREPIPREQWDQLEFLSVLDHTCEVDE